VARGTTGAPRSTPGQDTRNSRAPGFGDPGADGVTKARVTGAGVTEARATGARVTGARATGAGVTGAGVTGAGITGAGVRGARPDQPRSGGSRLIAFVCGRRSKYLVVVFWVVVVAALGGLAGKLQGAEKNDASSYLPASAESTQELNQQNLFQSKNLNPALVVYVRDSGVTAADLQKANADARYFASLPVVNGRVAPPAVSKDHKAIQTVIGADLGYNSNLSGFVTNVKNTASKDSAGLSVYVGGPAASAADQVKIFKGIDSTLLYATLAVVVVLLLLTYRSPVLWLLPILSAGVALTVAQAVIYLLTQHANLTVNGQSGGILVVLVIGASTDYALLLIARYREELRRHADRHQAMAVALRRAGPAIIASGLTVVAGMLCLLAAESNDISGLGPVAAIGIAVGLIAMVTLLPAVLVIFGRWIFWPVRPGFGSAEPSSRGLWSRVGHAISRRPRAVWMVTAIVLAAGTAGLIGFKFGPLTVAQSFRGTPSSITAQNELARYFPAGSGEPVEVVSTASSAGQVRAALADTAGIASVTHPVAKDGKAFLQATMTPRPDSTAAYTLVAKIRTTVHAIPGADAKVGGGTAINKDVENAATHDRNLLIPLILGVVLIILGLLLRAIVAPLVLIGTVVLSFGAALGISSLFFKHVFGFAGADTSMPLFVFVFLVALGIDYNIFLMTRVREESIRSGTRTGALTGLAATGGVITSAGLVLAGTFAMLGTLPLVQFTEIGFAVALGVLLDTIIVRSVLVTALTLDIGRHIWWPSALGRPRQQAPLANPESRAVTGGT
jgi:RND superfamily putative drug exporter